MKYLCWVGLFILTVVGTASAAVKPFEYMGISKGNAEPEALSKIRNGGLTPKKIREAGDMKLYQFSVQIGGKSCDAYMAFMKQIIANVDLVCGASSKEDLDSFFKKVGLLFKHKYGTPFAIEGQYVYKNRRFPTVQWKQNGDVSTLRIARVLDVQEKALAVVINYNFDTVLTGMVTSRIQLPYK